MGDVIKLGRFETDSWELDHDWYSWGGNRPVCGWYLTNTLTKAIKPLYITDLDDIYIVKHAKQR